MARPKQFDPDAVVQEALDAFWEHGYTATSVHDLLEEMGLNRGSLYGTFGDKKKLFLSVLDKYYEQRMADFADVLSEPSGRRAIELLLRRVAEQCTSEEGSRGCLGAKAAMELAPHDKDVADWFKRFHHRNTELLAKVIERGQQQGEISTRTSAQVLARFIINNIGGLRLLGTSSPGAAEVGDVIEIVLQALD